MHAESWKRERKLDKEEDTKTWKGRREKKEKESKMKEYILASLQFCVTLGVPVS